MSPTRTLLALLTSLSLTAAACGAQESESVEPAPAVTEAPAAPAAAADPAAAPGTEPAADPADPPVHGAGPTGTAPTDPASPSSGTGEASSGNAGQPTAGFPVTVVQQTRGPSGPARHPASITAKPGLNSVEIDVLDLATYCEPAPSFTSAVQGDTLRVTLSKPTGPVSKCFAPYALTLKVDLPGRNNVRQVVLVRHDGTEIAKATVKKQ